LDLGGRYRHLGGDETKMSIEETLKERESRYGSFKRHSRIAQNIQTAMADGNWSDLSSDKREALQMIAHKIARILNGDQNYADNWHDIAGYAILVEDIINDKTKAI
jgi:hypothetical protein